MNFGLGVLRLSPTDFWAMTPRELASAAEGVYGRQIGAPAPLTLKRLMLDFPDS